MDSLDQGAQLATELFLGAVMARVLCQKELNLGYEIHCGGFKAVDIPRVADEPVFELIEIEASEQHSGELLSDLRFQRRHG